ncbi:MAG: Na(+)/H(+) antiporter subunit E1 [Gammaproteobacteria bacterium]|nr:Na(+)/H(+) antiporter subunit E1 [Gammaproteobacteria bacterium]
MTVKISRVLTLLFILACFWLALSGFFKPSLLVLGAASCLFVTWLALRASPTDRDSALTQIHWIRWCCYKFWLAGQIVKATIDVAIRIVDPKLPISPTVNNVRADLPDLGKVIYANSITLTPGTVSINLTDDEIVVHSLTRRGISELMNGAMYRRVKELQE